MKLKSHEVMALDVASLHAGAAEQHAAAIVGGSRVQGSIAIIPIIGMISHRERFSFFGVASGASIVRIRQRLLQALSDEAVTAVVLYIDSPGGTIAGVDELAAEIRAARAQKPIIAIADTVAASAAYWLGCQASEFVATPSASVGNIGVMHVHESLAGQLEAAGIEITMTTAGKYKGERYPFRPLTDEAKAALQKDVDDAYSAFVAAVAAGRGVRPAAVRNGYGEGRTVSAKDALSLGMIDKIEPLQAAIARIARNPSRIKPKAGGVRAEAGDAAGDDEDDGLGVTMANLDHVSGSVGDEPVPDVVAGDVSGDDPSDPQAEDVSAASGCVVSQAGAVRRRLRRAFFA